MSASFCRLNIRQLRRKLRQLRRKNVYNIVMGLKISAAVLICKNDKKKKVFVNTLFLLFHFFLTQPSAAAAVKLFTVVIYAVIL